MKIVSVVLFALLLPGCSTLFMVSTASNYLVDKYCSVPQDLRYKFRKVVADKIEPNSIAIRCNPK